MEINLQPTLENSVIKIRPLATTDFETLYAAAADPLIWEQHPNKNRWQRPDFENYFTGAIESGGAFLISDAQTGDTIGSSRFYGWNEEVKSIFIGYTFLVRSHWGGRYNPAVKSLMLHHAFSFADKVQFHIGAVNRRSQLAMEKLGGERIGEKDMAYYGEPSQPNFVYQITKEQWKEIVKKNAGENV